MVRTQMLLVRHGQSVWNAEGRWQGTADPPLSELGRDQARLAVNRLGTVDDIISSDLERAAQTAEIIASGLGIGPVTYDERLRERGAGEWTGLTRADIDRKWPGAVSRGERPPGFEPDEPVVVRMLAALLSHGRRLGEASALVVAHGGVIRAIEQFLAGPDEQLAPLPNLAGRWVVVTHDDVSLGERVLLLDPDEIAVTIPNHL